MKALFIGLCLAFSTLASAFEPGTEIPSVTLKNQFDEPMQLTAETKKLFFTPDKKAATVMNEYLQENSKKLDEAGALYVSDISRMPSMITKMFAMPAMKKYPFKIALDRDGELTKNWPREKDKLTVVELNNQKVVSVRFIGTKEEVADALKPTVSPPK